MNSIPERAQQLNRAGAAAVPPPAMRVPPPPPVPRAAGVSSGRSTAVPDPSADRPLPFTEEDVELIREALGTLPPGYAYRRGIAEVVLSALAAAGRLLPPDADRTEEWTYTYRHARDGQLRSGEDGGELYETRVEVETQFAFWAQQYPDLPRRELRCVRRDVFTGPWVADDGSTE